MNSEKRKNHDLSNSQNILDGESAYRCWPFIRNDYRKKTLNANKTRDSNNAILIESKALSCGFIGAQLDTDQSTPAINDQSISRTIHLQQQSGNSLIDYLTECMDEIKINETNKTTSADVDSQKEIGDLCAKCSNLPKEWNVIQLNQLYNGYDRYGSKKDLYTSDGPITLTLFRHNLSEKCNNRILNLVLELNELDPKSVSS